VPQILTANRLSDGAVVYWTADGGWAERLETACVVADPSAAEAAGKQAQERLLVVGAYLMDVRAEASGLAPVKMREIIRAAGPSVRLDLGKQAEA
jgi:Protein of unknown function (DUF2849)